MKVNISGPARILWGEGNFVDSEGEHEIPFGQIPGADDLELVGFVYTGNAKTGKFYPSDSYFARCVEVRHRRFFDSKEEVVEAGFIASKPVK